MRSKNSSIILVLVLFVIALFAYSVFLRAGRFGDFVNGRHTWLTGSTVKFTDYWYKEGAAKMKFAMVENPKSVEFSDLKSRDIYVSYPIGTLLPVFSLAKISGLEPTVSLVMSYNLFSHFIIALALALSAFLILVKTGANRFIAFLYSLVPVAIILFLPGPLYYLQNVYYSDQAVLLPFALIILLEALLYKTKPESKFKLEIVEGLILFWGMSVDWLFVPLSFVLFAKKIIEFFSNGDSLRTIALKSFWFWLPVVLAVVFFLLYVYQLDAFDILKGKFLFRMGATSEGKQLQNFFVLFWNEHLPLNLGKMAKFIIPLALILTLTVDFLTLAWRLISKQKVDQDGLHILLMINLIILTCYLQIYLFKNHSAQHDFSSLKFALVMAMLPFVLMPHFLYKFLSADLLNEKRLKYEVIICLLAFMVSGTYIRHYWPQQKSIYMINSNGADFVLAEFVQENSKYNDIIFAKSFAIPENPPQLLAISKKRVYQADGLADMAKVTDKVSGDYKVGFLFQNGEKDDPFVGKLVSLGESVTPAPNGYTLIRLSKDQYSKMSKGE